MPDQRHFPSFYSYSHVFKSFDRTFKIYCQIVIKDISNQSFQIECLGFKKWFCTGNPGTLQIRPGHNYIMNRIEYKEIEFFLTISDFPIPISLQPYVVYRPLTFQTMNYFRSNSQCLENLNFGKNSFFCRWIGLLILYIFCLIHAFL